MPASSRRAVLARLAMPVGNSPSPAQREKGFSVRSLPHRPERALLLRSGRRASFPTLAVRFGISPSPAQREKVARSAGRRRERSELLLLFQATSKAHFAAPARPHP